MDSKRVSLSMALIVLICFFLPWVQLSCGGSENRLSGVDLARDGRGALWLIPLLMLAVIFFGVMRRWQEKRELAALTGLVAGLVSAYLMNRERTRAEHTTNLIAVALTGWFWLGLAATIGLTAVSGWRLLAKRKE
jgi:hypothetical protein